MDINNVVLVGRLTKDEEVKYTNSGMAIGKLSLAVNKKRKQNDEWIDEVNFFDVIIFGKSAESLQQYLKRGKQVGIQGELKQNRWEQDGQKRSKVEIVANNIQLLGGNQNTGNSQSNNQNKFEDDIPW